MKEIKIRDLRKGMAFFYKGNLCIKLEYTRLCRQYCIYCRDTTGRSYFDMLDEDDLVSVPNKPY